MKLRMRAALLLPLYLFFFAVFSSATAQDFTVKNGQIDLTGWKISSDASLELKGEWGFFWEELLQTSKPAPDFVTVPDVWTAKSKSGKNHPSFGYATYTLKVLLPKDASNLSLHIKQPMTAVKVFANGKELGEIGKVGKTKKSYTPAAKTRNFPLPDSPEVDIVIQVANFDYTRSGLYNNGANRQKSGALIFRFEFGCFRRRFIRLCVCARHLPFDFIFIPQKRNRFIRVFSFRFYRCTAHARNQFVNRKRSIRLFVARRHQD